MSDLPPESHRLDPDHHPTPFSAAQIRDASGAGTSVTFRIDPPGEDAYLDRWEFLGGDDDGGLRRRWTETLEGDGPFTVLAPTDEAFAALPEGTVDSLLEDPEGALTDILNLHVISGEAMSTDVVAIGDGGTVDTLGGAVTVNIDGDAVSFGTGEAALVTADVETDNGVIHIIDGVITEAG